MIHNDEFDYQMAKMKIEAEIARMKMPIVSSPVPGLEVTDSRFEEQVARAEIVAKIEKYLERFLPHCRTNEDAAISQTLIQTRALLLARRIKE